MQFRPLNILLVVTLSVVASACSGGSSPSSVALIECRASGENVFCLTTCNLGCSSAGCSINKIAQNEEIYLTFSQAVDPFSVPPYRSSILLRTPSGEEPRGDWSVLANQVTFRPSVLISGASTFFGFKPNETYSLHMPAGAEEPDVVSSLSGDRLTNQITCSLNIGGIRDLNQVCPSAKLIQPTNTVNVPLATIIVIEFNEIIDPSIFDGITPETSPIRYVVSPTAVVGGEKVCNTSAPGVILPGLPRVTIDQARGRTIATYVPQEPLPADKCVQVEITAKVRDLAGVPACAHILSFITVDQGRVEQGNREDFANSQYLDTKLSAGTWGGGSLTFSPIGGNGVLGAFEPSHGRDITASGSTTAVYEWDTDSQLIPGAYTNTGKDIWVTDGRFFFASMEIPDGVEVHFVGSNPARIWVRGAVVVGGLLSANGRTIGAGDAAIQLGKSPQPGEPGGTPGCFGGIGGVGADRGSGNGTPSTAYNGKTGSTVALPVGHAYLAKVAGSGGLGSPQHPADNDDNSIGFGYFNSVALEINRGGGGGAFTGPGGIGEVRWDLPDPNNGRSYMATGTTPGGVAMSGGFPANFPSYTNGFTHQDHYLVGGSGGGGGGSCVSGAVKNITSNSYWRIGRAGGGGGGALALRTGGSLTLEPSGRITADGGTAAYDTAIFTLRGLMTPGGGGSGGSLFLQVNLETQNSGLISVAGGDGGVTKGAVNDALFRNTKQSGGDGSPGVLHFEVSSDPNSYPVGNTIPSSPPVASIDPADFDNEVAIRSTWYPASLLFPPDFVRYEIEAVIDGVNVLYSDNPNHSDPTFGGLAHGPASPVQFTVQGARLEYDATQKLVPKPNTAISPFRKYVGQAPANSGDKALSDDGATGYRFELALDRSLGKSVEIKAITVFWKL
jgi:hypothetical protein